MNPPFLGKEIEQSLIQVLSGFHQCLWEACLCRPTNQIAEKLTVMDCLVSYQEV